MLPWDELIPSSGAPAGAALLLMRKIAFVSTRTGPAPCLRAQLPGALLPLSQSVSWSRRSKRNPEGLGDRPPIDWLVACGKILN